MTWILPTFGFVAATGALGITTRLALRSMDWPELVLWAAIAYVLTAALIVAVGHGALTWNSDTRWAVLSGILPVASLVLLFLALSQGEVSRVVPVSAAYPLVTVLLAALVLGEAITAGGAAGILLVVSGVVLLSRGHAIA